MYGFLIFKEGVRIIIFKIRCSANLYVIIFIMHIVCTSIILMYQVYCTYISETIYVQFREHSFTVNVCASLLFTEHRTINLPNAVNNWTDR